ncbi:hypothetical protein F383_31938 [Gossypium arboreum]|uniref:Uncharacterized protein n=1 Tax=Gossypium arboreum TaxID=29729 RepID=A0A0B0MEZ0_GOSAR|nr:hypothetical protein F383_39021 [Gossypium arboreum]KHG25439.1 hypothetical protein F383_31888 [Gossypium arboreum]KHG26060.1 hypothetical protein F383_31938 [Gossypium arboreum]
MHISSTNM